MYNPLSNKLQTASQMNYSRWYPTLAGLPNGESLILGGRAEKPTSARSKGVATPEIYNTASGTYRSLTGAGNNLFVQSWYYPRAFVGNTGRVYIARNGSSEIWSMNWKGKGSVKKDAKPNGNKLSQRYPSAMYKPGKVLTLTSNKGARIILDLTRNKASARDTSSPGTDRIFGDTTILADGQVLLTGGSSEYQNLDTAHYAAQIWSPGNEQWRTVASASKARLYHSTSLLLPNGTVLTTGGGPPSPIVNMNAEIYYPSYLFKKDGSGDLANRPSITSMPSVRYGRTFNVDDESDSAINYVAMIRTGSVTHSFDQSQRYVPLDFSINGNQLKIDGPKNRKIAPKGQYMLVIIDSAGVPSHAEMFQPI